VRQSSGFRPASKRAPPGWQSVGVRRASGVRALAAAAVVAATAAGLSACGPPSADPTAKAYLTAWSRSDLAATAKLTDDPNSALAALTETDDGLGHPKLAVVLGDVTTHSSDAVAAFTAHVDVPGLATWTYQGRLLLHRTGDHWQVHWTTADIHPALAPTTHIAVVRELPPRAALLDDHGRPLFTMRPVVHIGIEPARLRGHAAATIATVTRAVGVHDVAGLRKAVRAAGPHDFVPVITLRRPAYDAVKSQIYQLPGTVFHADRLLLPPQTGFGQALLGTVGPATADVLKAAGPGYRAGDVLGLSGLQAHFQQRLAGRAGGRIAIENRIGTALRTLATFAPTPGTPVRTTLDIRTQTAAEDALAHETKPAALVAVRASTGDILAVANTPDSTSYDRALEGHYPPGSTFKVVTTYALLGHGVTTSTPIDCPPSITVGGRVFRNFEGETASHPPFSVDFAKSCNTAFIGAAQRLSPKELTDAAVGLGLDNQWRLPLPAFAGAVPPPPDDVTKAADAIGQGSVSVSPLDMAVVAASVASGRTRAPVLVTDPKQPPPSISATPLEAGRLAALRSLMRLVVTSGTASGAGLPAGTHGKTGTAEFGTGPHPQTHAWFIGWRGDVAFAVLVEGGGIGGAVAAPIAADFLHLL
jgi:cell division protein FtsI/penicillin-binding protein 2